jgi:hypothetical protein
MEQTQIRTHTHIRHLVLHAQNPATMLYLYLLGAARGPFLILILFAIKIQHI